MRTKGHSSAVPPLFTGHCWPVRSSPRPTSGFRCNGLPVPVYSQCLDIAYPENWFLRQLLWATFEARRLWGLSACGRSFSVSAFAPTPPGESCHYLECVQIIPILGGRVNQWKLLAYTGIWGDSLIVKNSISSGVLPMGDCGWKNINIVISRSVFCDEKSLELWFMRHASQGFLTPLIYII
jgi:hypothetical protein